MPEQSPEPLDKCCRRSKKGDLDQAFAQKYFTLLVGQYKTMSTTVVDPAARLEADRVVEIPVEKISWEQIYRLELAMLKLEPKESLCRKAWILREEYQEVASPTEYAQYLASKLPVADPATVNEAALRADLVKIQEELNWAYIILWVYEEFRSKLTRRIVIMALCAGVVFGVFLQLANWNLWGELPEWSKPTLLTVAFAGMIGGFISTLRRIQTTKLDWNSDLSLIELEKGQGSIYISPFLGAVFAIVLYVLFASGLLKGALFPNFDDLNFDSSKGGFLYGFAIPLEGF